jgi:hypothetical protein
MAPVDLRSLQFHGRIRRVSQDPLIEN